MHNSPFKTLLLSIFILMLSAGNAYGTELIWQGAATKKPQQINYTHNGEKFSALRIVFGQDDDFAGIKITAKHKTGLAEYEYRFSARAEAKNGTNQLIDDLPQMPGPYDVSISGKSASCSVYIERFADLEPFLPGDQLGEILLTGSGNSPVSVSPEGFKIKHPNFKNGMEKGVATPDGRVIFRLPAGYWSLKRFDNGTENARLIPVSSGRRTVVRWAPSQEISLENDSKQTARRLEIRQVSIAIDTSLAISRFALPAGLSTFTPAIEHLQAFERSLPAEIIDLKQSDAPLHLILLLDSSGSMKKSMKTAINASVEFIEKLPAEAIIEVIDFDTKPRPVKAKTRPELVKAVKAIKPDGATCLRDSVILGLERLKGSSRPALVVFTDGFDANHNDTGPGSKADEKEVFLKVAAAKIPVFTIGFGDNADTQTLARLADLSGGIFQSADEKSLSEVFSRLETIVSREYLLTYRRPQQAGNGIRPVISICVDTSGSMNSNLDKNQTGNRRELAKNTLHRMLRQLPANALVQILDFDSQTEITQTATSNRARNHSGLAAFKGGGGTEVLKALEVALKGLFSVPSNRRYMLFLTDAAIKTRDKKQEERLNRLLARIKDEGIISMWIGMVDKSGASPFIETARKSGGEVIIADSLAALEDTINKLLARVAEPVKENHSPFELVWQMPQTEGLPVSVSGNGVFELPPIATPASGTREAIDSLQISVEDMTDEFVGKQVAPARKRAGNDGSESETPVTGTGSDLDNIDRSLSTNAATGDTEPGNARMTINLDVTGQNDACRFLIRQMALYESLSGIKAPKNKLFATFDLELTNMLPEQDVLVYPDGAQHPARWVKSSANEATNIKAIPPYQINDLRRHLYLRWNNEPACPCSPATWLLSDSILPFGSNAISIKPGQPLSGKVVFIVSEDQGLTNGSIDYYDHSYGHCSMVIAGKMEAAGLRAASLPKSPAGKLGSAFNIQINAVEDFVSPLSGATAGQHLVWRTIDFIIESQVQALLDLEPKSRMYLVLPTEAGPVRRPVSEVTGLLPGGFYEKAKLAPGSANHFKQAFLLPAELAAKASGTLCVDMRGEDTLIGLNPSEPSAGITENRSWDSEGNGLKLKINAHGKISGLNGRAGDWYVVDATVADLQDGNATRLAKLLYLGRADLKDQGFLLKPGQRLVKEEKNKADKKNLGALSSKKDADGNQVRIYPDSINQKLLFAASDENFVPDGQETRFIAVFKMPGAGEYLLAAEGLPLTAPLASQKVPNIPAWLLSVNDETVPTFPEAFEKQLAARLNQLAIANRRQKRNPVSEKEVDAGGTTSEKPQSISPPLICPDAKAEDNHLELEILVEAEPVAESAAAQTGAAASALSGGTNKARIFKMLKTTLSISDTCKTPFEIFYREEPGKDGEKSLKVRVMGIWGTSEGQNSIDLNNWKPVRERITISGKGISWPDFERELDTRGLKDRLHSIALGIPDISPEQAEDLSKRWNEARTEKAPDHFSLWQWFAHARLAAFIIAQTEYEKNLQESLNLTLSRNKTPRLFILTGCADANGAFEARLDLVNVQPGMSGDEQAVQAFRIAAGIYVTDLEARIMQGLGVFQFWGNNRLQVIAGSGKQKNTWLKFAASRGVNERTLKALRATRSVVLFPLAPATVNNQPFWAWLEIDPRTYATIGVLESGERGTIAGEGIIQALIPDGAGLALGFWKGVETSIWGMSAFILQGNSAAEAAENTAKFLGGLTEHLGKVGDSFEIPVGDASIDLLSGKVSLAGFSSEGDYSPWDGYKGFVSGFNAGASWYLGKVKAAAARK
ncbi:MAG: VWA domain-containing protein [Candidatus Riflebacteria bacterium]|nr:VWA domain-containing protein [Candidatus Riflebacteria bacterium]